MPIAVAIFSFQPGSSRIRSHVVLPRAALRRYRTVRTETPKRCAIASVVRPSARNRSASFS